MTQIATQGTLRFHLADATWPVDFFTPDDLPGFLDRIYVVESQVRTNSGQLDLRLQLAFAGELAIRLPGLDGVSLVFGGDPQVEGVTLIGVRVTLGTRREIVLDYLSFALRFDRDLLTPAPDETGQVAEHAQIYVTGSIAIDDNFDVQVRGFDAIELTPVMLGSSGIVLSASRVKLDLSRTTALPEVLAAGFDEDFLGVFLGEAKIRFPDNFPSLAPEDLVLRDAAIGSGGVTGTLVASYTPVFDEAAQRFTGRGAGELGGVPFGLREVDIAVRRNGFERARLAGDLLLPFFDLPVEVEVGLTLDGGLTVALGRDEDLITLRREGVVEVVVDSLGFVVDGDGLTTRLSGTVRPLLGGLAWPAFEVRELEIDSRGNVRCDGGWIDLPNQYALDFHGFATELTKLGFGRDDDGGRWIAVSGSLQLGAELRAGASLDGLRVTWYSDGRPPRLGLDGIDVELDLPEVLRFRGRVGYRELPGPVHRFDGGIALELLALDLRLDAQLVIGTGPNGAPFLGIHIAGDLPGGIPLWATGLSLYGISGLFALNLAPDRAAAEPWYDGWYKRPPVGAAELTKWAPRDGARGFGAGITIGTTADNGFTLAARTSVILLFPGPIVLVEGRANLFRERARLSDEPAFSALAVLDKQSDTFLVGLTARYQQGDDGRLIDIGGRAEGFFPLSRGDDWHLYLGERTPPDRRIKAKALSLFEADAYLMLDANGLALGASAGWDKQWKFGPLQVSLSASIAADAAVSWRPLHFHGEIGVHGAAGLSVYGYGLSVSVDARLAADVFDPYHLLGQFHVGIGLPWPLPDFSVDVSMEWGPEPIFPSLPALVKEVTVEHFKVTSTWPLPVGGLLVPRVDRGDGYLLEPVPVPPLSAPPPATAPVVPLDARPRITFARPVHDDARAGVNGRETVPARERLGDPQADEGPVLVRYGLREVALDAWRGATWMPIARSVGPGQPPNPPGLPRLWGSWAPLPALPDLGGTAVAQVKLFLWSRTPFDHTTHTGGAWDEWITDHATDLPCLPIPEPVWTCHGLTGLTEGDLVEPPWTSPDVPGFTVAWNPPVMREVHPVDDGLPGASALCLPPRLTINALPVDCVMTVSVPAPSRAVRLGVVDPTGVTVTARHADGTVTGPYPGGTSADPWVTVPVADVVELTVTPGKLACVYQLCLEHGLSDEELADRQDLQTHVQGEVVRWSQDGHVLEPDTAYRLRIVSTVTATGEGELAGQERDHAMEQLAYFRTGGPPGLVTLSTPEGYPGAETFRSGLDDLTRYVRQTVPPTVPAAGEALVPVRPVFRAYDLGVEFNEDYVELMYRLGGRDLGMYLFDSNSVPVRDPGGRLVQPRYRWARSSQPGLTEAEQWWLEVVGGSSCLAIDPTTIPHPAAMVSTGTVLPPDATIEARLVPLVFRDGFEDLPVGASAVGDGAVLGHWWVDDVATEGGPGRWVIEDGGSGTRALVQLGSIGAVPADLGDARRPGTLLRREVAASDYRVTGSVRSTSGGAVGIAARVSGSEAGYLFVMDRGAGYRRLVRMQPGEWAVLAEDQRRYPAGRDHALSLEVLGTWLRAYVDGAPVFQVKDAAYATGGVALHTQSCADAHWRELRVDDLGAGAPVVYKFGFTTSRFTSVYHLAHGGEQRRSTADPPAGLIALVGAAVSPATPPTDDEHRAYDAAAGLVQGPAMHRRPPALEITRLADAAGLVGFLLASPEPLAWPRLALTLRAGPARPRRDRGPGPARLTEASVGQVDPSAESITVLLDESVDPTTIAVEHLALPGAVDLAGGELIFDERFPGPAGTLHVERFGPGASERFTLLDHGDQDGPSRWRSEDGRMRQLSPIYGGDLGGSDALRPGTMALLGGPSWGDLTIDTVLRTGAPGAIGLVFRHGATGDYYRFAMDRSLDQRRLVRVDAGIATVLWEQAQGFELDRDYRLRVQVLGDTLVGWLDDGLLFQVVDPGPRLGGGQLGWYCWHNDRAEFAALEVSTLEIPPMRWTGDLGELAAWEVRDDLDATDGPSRWEAGDGLRQLTAIGGVGGDGFALGTVAVTEGVDWDDVGFDVVAIADAVGTLGVQFHDRGAADYYRLTLDAATQTSRLIRRQDGVAVELWSGPGGYQPGVEVHLTITTVSDQIIVVVDGVERARVLDGTLRLGGLGLFTSGDAQATFRTAAVAERRRMVAGWRMIDLGHDHGPSRWRADGELTEDSGLDGDGPVPAACPGAYAIASAAVPDQVRLEATLRADGDGAVGVVVRWVDADNHYRVSLDRTAGVHRLIRKAAGVTTVLWEAPGGYTPGHPFRVVVDAVGDRLRGTLDGAPWFDLVDPTHPAGGVGFYAWRNPGAAVLRMVARRPPLEAFEVYRDRFAAADLSGWDVIDEGTASAPSQWRLQDSELRQQSLIFGPMLQPASPIKAGTMAVVGDPSWADMIVSVRLASGHGGTIGVVFRYQAVTDHYRFTMDRNARYRRLIKRAGGDHVVLWEDRVQYELDRPYELTVVAAGAGLRGYLDGVPLFDVADADLGAGRVGLYAWHNSDARFSQLRMYRPEAGFAAWDLSDGFASLSRLLWEPVDDALYATPSRWAADGYLRQPVPVPGTSLVGGDRGWADVRVTATVIAATAGAVGVVARYRGPGDHYALTVTSDPIGLGRAQLVATAGGVATELWEGAVAVKPQGQHLITLDVVGDRLTAWVDGNRLTSVVDQTHAAGRVGVRTEQAADARVTSIRVAQARWAHYGDLAAEPGEAPLAPGMRVRVSALDVLPPTGEANLRVAAAAETGGPGRAVLGPGIDPVWLRLRQRRTGQPDMVHDTLGVRRATDDVQSGARVLRRRDGTGVLVFPDTANLDSGYRLSLTYARAGIAGLPDLAEAGLNDPERVTIELP